MSPVAKPDVSAAVTALDALAASLQESLPTGSRLLVLWDDKTLGRGHSPAQPQAVGLLERGLHLLEGATTPTPLETAQNTILESWRDEDGARIGICADLSCPLSGESRTGWLSLARRAVAMTLAQAGSQVRIEALQKSQHLQQALYEIADLAGSRLEMEEMLSRIHAVVGTLMVAENFYIVRCDEELKWVQFLYFVDTVDTVDLEDLSGSRLDVDVMRHSLTLSMLRRGQSLHGSSDEIRKRLGSVCAPEHGPDAADWLGVPMLRDGIVRGGVVVQSYDQIGCYSAEERALLEYVAQHILTTLDRKYAQAELERRVTERTGELQRTNAVLQAEIEERQRAETLQRALHRIAERSAASETMAAFYADVHAIVSELLNARNFYIATLSDDGRRLEFPYSVDERDPDRMPRTPASGLTEYVLRHGRSLCVDRAGIAELTDRGELRTSGAHALCWLGVPLMQQGKPLGVLAVQSYTPDVIFDADDEALLTYVALHISGALERRRSQDSLRLAHQELEARVEMRTQQLAIANEELRGQIGESERMELQLVHQARHDALTGLPNRAFLLERLNAAIARQQGNGKLAILFMDLDRFKLINDSSGHAAGDEMLIQTAKRLQALVDDHGFASRFGGDEFAVLVDDCEGLLALERLTHRIQLALSEPLWIAGRELFPTVSIGIARWHPRYRNGEELLRDADVAMYRAKASGRDRSILFDEAMREEATRLLDLESDLRRAIKKDAFEAYFQPIVNLADGAVVGHEALLRWNHDTRGLLTPSDFIGVGEDSGLIEEIDWLLYGRVMRWLATRTSGYASINVSPRHMRSGDFASRLLALASDHGADPRRLRIEITEVALLDDSPQVLYVLNTLRSHGIAAQLDDFGTGFSALSYLHRFPIQAIKIDRSFISGLTGAKRIESLALVRAILAMASTLGIDCIGEGIETETQHDLLLGLGCQFGQGYLFGRPEPAVATEAAVLRFPRSVARRA